MTPILVAAAGRSGTTFLMQLLANHPAVQADEVYPLEFRPFLLSLFPDDPTCNESTLFRLPGNQSLTTEQALEFYHLAAVAAGKRPSHFAEKMPGLAVGRILETSPDAKIICLFRDPRDVHMSMVEFTQRRGGKGKFGELEAATERDVVFNFATTFYRLLSTVDFYPNNASKLYYEHLMDERASAALINLFAWLGLAADENTIEIVLKKARFSTVEEHRTKPSDTATVGRWRYEMPVPLMRLYLDEMDEMLEAMGYPLKAEFP